MPPQEDRHKFDEAVDSYYERIFRGALSVTGDRHLAEEIVQETFLSALKKFDGFSARSSMFTWLYTIMLNKYRDHCRRARLRRRLGFARAGPSLDWSSSQRYEEASPYAKAANLEDRELLLRAVQKLPLKMREVIAMRYFDGLLLSEMAAILNCRLGTVKSRLANARKRLWRMLRGKFI